jgi:hypothetical protein
LAEFAGRFPGNLPEAPRAMLFVAKSQDFDGIPTMLMLTGKLQPVV